MKNSKRIPAIIMAIIIALSVTLFVGPSASAANEGIIKITVPPNFTLEGQEFRLYRLFDIETISTAPPDLELSYEIAPNFEDFRYDGNTLFQFLTDPNLNNPGKLPDVKPLNSPEMFDMLSELWKYIEDETIVPDKGFEIEPGVSIPDVTLVFADVFDEGGIKVGEIIKSVIIENLPYGYYLIYGSGLVTNLNDEEVVAAIAAVSIYETSPSVEVILKVDAPELDKWVWNQHDDFGGGEVPGDWARWTDASIGSTVRFKLESRVPNMRGYKSYTFTMHDIMSAGLTFDPDSVEVFVGGVPYSDYTVHFPPDTPHQVDQIGNCTFEIVFDPDKFIELTTGQSIEVFFSAVINEKAIIELLGNPNDAYLEYSSSPYNPNKRNRTPPSKVKVYTGILKIIKTDNRSRWRGLAGATFILKDKDNNPIQFRKVTLAELAGQLEHMAGYSYAWFEKANIYMVVSDDLNKAIIDAIRAKMEAAGEDEADILEAIKAEEAKITTELESPASGEIIVIGLGASYAKGNSSYDNLGTYFLEETKAPDWFNILHDIIEVQIRIFQSKLFNPGITDDNTYWRYFDDIFDEVKEIRIPFLVANESVFPELPETGGIGMRIFIIGGLALMGLALVGLVVVIARKRKYKKVV